MEADRNQRRQGTEQASRHAGEKEVSDGQKEDRMDE